MISISIKGIYPGWLFNSRVKFRLLGYTLLKLIKDGVKLIHIVQKDAIVDETARGDASWQNQFIFTRP